jgi:uncharacterized membrane protein
MEFDGLIQMMGKWVAGSLELFGMIIIGLAFFHAVARGLLHFLQRKPNAFSNMKVYLGKSLQLALEFLVAADIIRTVTVEATREGLLALGMLVVLRTMLSWSITVEIEGRWPWQAERKGKE